MGMAKGSLSGIAVKRSAAMLATASLLLLTLAVSCSSNNTVANGGGGPGGKPEELRAGPDRDRDRHIEQERQPQPMPQHPERREQERAPEKSVAHEDKSIGVPRIGAAERRLIHRIDRHRLSPKFSLACTRGGPTASANRYPERTFTSVAPP